MFRKAVWILFLGCLPGAAADPPERITVWAVGDSVRVDPVRGRAFEDEPLLFPDCQTGDYKSSNLVWDGQRKRISLRAARNETVAFQLVVERGERQKLTNVNVTAGELTGPGGARIPAANIDLFKQWYVNVTKVSQQSYTLGTGWYPDALLPAARWKGKLYPHTYVMPFDIPDLMNHIGPRQKNQALWVDIYVPAGRNQAPPGTYTGTITVTSDAGRADLSIQLDVWDFALPEESHIKGNIHTNTEIHSLPEDLELRYYHLIRKHRLAMGVLGYAPDMKVSGSGVEIDWKAYDARLSKYLDGSAFTERYGYAGPGRGVPIEFLVTPFDAFPVNLYKQSVGISIGKEFKFYRPWPVEVPKEGPTPEYAEIWKDAFRKVDAHLSSRPEWSKTRLVVFLLSLDEAYDEVARERMFYYGGLLKESGAKRLEYRVDGWYPRETMLRLADVLKIAILGLGGWNPETVDEIRKRGVDPWFYNGTGWIDGTLIQCRAMGWTAWKYRAGSWTLWELDFNSLRAWFYPETYPNQNGHGMLVYRGETVGLEEPVASIRLKSLRRGSQDYEYFWLLSQKPGGRARADAVVNGIVNDFVRFPSARMSPGEPGMWKQNPEAWEQARYELGAAIEKAGR